MNISPAKSVENSLIYITSECKWLFIIVQFARKNEWVLSYSSNSFNGLHDRQINCSLVLTREYVGQHTFRSHSPDYGTVLRRGFCRIVFSAFWIILVIALWHSAFVRFGEIRIRIYEFIEISASILIRNIYVSWDLKMANYPLKSDVSAKQVD